ncbi:GHKL domain-containing protein [Clostridium tagluense]|uniref:sensor histidine kinase n=1 Tax=Clostridium tagluense TaxID=360422 RepID=UPI001C0D467D|nr:GHKL domain-containing protein [Clostridium tagluense]MBU3129928.1 GHKL domain-containing protein [Clostridium tagluense]MCB2311943.1 GHKL domain-containing protein [Clostridium tagluense]MCB2318146.1 GHKL domain-containing protein [Clostridium tagluense]MCB2323317.1 GHKL domain-containing protein [Clostridium tagluense]MCB2327930.1 GHKL domain-containing protein [Clostridium tagluense]
MWIINIVLLFIMFYVQLYIGCKLKEIKFNVNTNNFITILSSSILYYYVLKINYLNDYKVIITTIFLMIILAVLIEHNILYLIQTTFFITLIMILSESLTAQFFINVLNLNSKVLSTNKITFIFFNIILFITAVFIINLKEVVTVFLISKFKIKDNDFMVNTIFMASLMIVFIVIYFLAYKSFNKDTVVITFLSSIVCLMLILIFFHKNYMLKVKQQEIIQLKTYTSIIENLVDDVSKFKHDYNNIIFMVKGYLEDNNVEELKRIFNKELIHECDYENNEILKLKKIKDAGLKGLLTSKIVKFYLDNITLSIEVLDTIDTFNIDIIDLCRIVGILLDNAYEAAKDSKEKLVSISFIQDECLNITIANSYNSHINISSIYKKSYSTKGHNRGIGLNNVKEIINKKYPNVLLKTSIEKDFFIQDLYIEAK